MTEDLKSKILAGLASLAMILIVGAVFGRLYGTTKQERDMALGDRVMCGLLALPLMALAIHLALPQSGPYWMLLGPAPVLIYTVRLAAEEKCPGKKWGISDFTRTLLVVIGAVYIVMFVLALLQI
jgi:ABC-type dipeptide/oligopeptide/nickel transport system permease subunit